MDVNRRIILFGLLVTLSSVRGGDFTYSEEAYEAALKFELAHDVEFQTAEKITFFAANQRLSWIVDPERVIEGTTQSTFFDNQKCNRDMSKYSFGWVTVRKMIPRFPKNMKTRIEGVENRFPEFLSYMLMSFHVVSHKTGSTSGNPEVGDDNPEVQTLYGKFVICFKSFQSSHLETCFYTLMFSPPEEKIYKYSAKILNPITDIDMDSIRKISRFSWKLDTFECILPDLSKAVLKSTASSSSSSNLAIHLQRGESAYYSGPILVEETLLKDYHAWVSQL